MGGTAGAPLGQVPEVVRPVGAVIFDMDGTLVQTRHASWEIFREVSRQFDLGLDSPQEYYDLFRRNLYAELERRCADAEQYRMVKEVLLERLRRDYHPVMIPGMLHVVRRLAAVATLALLSSNSMPVMRRILVENDLAFCFAHVFGGDSVPDKRAAIRQFLADTGSGFGRRCSADYDEAMVPLEVAAEGTVLVTDTAGDVEEALAEGIRAVGVTWGMHPAEELAEAGAEFVALWPQEVGTYLLQGIDAAPRGACEIVPGSPASACGVGGGGTDPWDCACGCTDDDPDGRRGAAGAAAGPPARRRRRIDAVQGLLAGSPAPGARGPALAELADAVRRICR